MYVKLQINLQCSTHAFALLINQETSPPSRGQLHRREFDAVDKNADAKFKYISLVRKGPPNNK